MGKTKVVALGTLVGVALTLAPLSSAFADTRFDRHWGHGSHSGGHGNASFAVHGGGYRGHGCYGCLWPFGLAAAAVGTVAAAVVNTAAAVVTLPFVALNAAANAPYYYASPAAYGPPAASDATLPSYYNNAPAAYYAPPARYYNSAPAPVHYGPPAAPAYDYGPPPDYYNQAPPAPGYYDYRR